MAEKFTKAFCPRLIILLASILSGLPAVAFADGGTPLLWTGSFHLLLGNFLIGCLEGALLARVFKVKKTKAVPIMILANYVSMALGYALTHPLYAFLFQRGPETAPLYKVPGIIWEMWVISFLLTVAIEWPFCLWLMRGAKNAAIRSIGASLLAQVASYLIIVPIYISVSRMDLYKTLKVDPSLAASTMIQGSAYYLSPDWKKICMINLNGMNGRDLQVKDNGKYDGGLELRKGTDPEHWDLVSEHGMDKFSLLISGIEGDATAGGEKGRYRYPADDLRRPGNHDWEVRACRNPFDNGVSAYNSRTKDSITTFIESPFTFWGASQPTVLPGDRVIFELSGQIVIMDLSRHTIGFMAYGHSPVVILKHRAE